MAIAARLPAMAFHNAPQQPALAHLLPGCVTAATAIRCRFKEDAVMT